ncbi:MAG: sulfotransferase [Gammaproteobacteria bacterium]|nr:sulfotransferase [Gammaproteobacteria bacterium]
MSRSYQPIIIVGAPRSGTNMLRDILCQIDGNATWPCDEINYIWRYGNASYPSDEFPPQRATPKIKKYINNKFDAIAKTYNAESVIEKTCANSIRLEFVNEVMQDAKYLFIYRDGIDVVASARVRWTADLDIGYILKKLKYVPIADLPYYGSRYLFNRFYRLFSKEKRLAYWGPQLDMLEGTQRKRSIHEICALQWQRCIEKSEQFLKTLPPERVYRIRYEDFVSAPEQEIDGVIRFIGKSANATDIKKLVSGISAGSIGKGRRQLSAEEIENLMPLIGPELLRLGYANQ